MTDLFGDLIPPASDPSFTGYIPGNPKPKEPKPPVFVPQGATQMFDPNTNTYVPVPKAPGGEEKDALKEAIAGLGVDELLSGIKRARKNLQSGWATGTWGRLAEMKPGGGTPRDDFLGQLKSIQGGIINEKLQALKEASKTGASGLGALSEKEGERLASSVAALTENMSQQAYEDSFKEIARHAYVLQAVRDGKDPRSPETQKEIEGQVNTFLATEVEPPSGNGGDAPPGVSELTPEQQAKDKAFRATNPTPEQYTSFLESLLNKPIVAEAAAARLKAGKAGAPYNAGVVDATYQDKLKKRIAAEDRMGVGDNAATTLATQGGTLSLSDEAAGGGNALSGIIAAPFTGKLDIGSDYRFGRDAERMRIANAREQLGYGGTAIELVSGAASAAPTAALSLLAPRAAAVAAGKAGAVGGALSGFGVGEGTDESVTGAAIGATAGGALGRYGPAAVERVLPRRFRAPQGMAPDVADAAAAENVDLIRPMVDPSSRSNYGALESNVYSQPIIRGAAARVRGQIEDRVEALGNGGAALDTGAAGDRVQDASRRFITRSRTVANSLYNRARAIAGPDATVTPRAALHQMRQELRALNETPEVNSGEIAFINELGADLANGPLTLDAIRNLRTSIRGRINQSGLTASQADARANRVLDALQQDVAASLPPGAATAYRRADAFYRERMTHVDDVISRFLGPRDRPISGEQAFARLKSMASPGGDGRRLAAIMRSLDGNERQDIAATIAQSLGRRSEDQPFSTALFLSHTSKLSPSARRTIFGPDGAQSIENLRLLSRSLEEAGQDINRSRSATVLERQGIRQAARTFIAGLAGLGGGAVGGLGGGLAGVTVAAGAMGASAARRVLSARAMVNPRVSRWLAESANASTPAQAKEAARKLSVIIAREPAISHELRPIYEMLENRLERPLAATEQRGSADDDRR